MMRPSHDRGRPLTTDGPITSIATDHSMVDAGTDHRPRCRRCGHVVFSAVSIRVGIGLACRRALARAAGEVAA